MSQIGTNADVLVSRRLWADFILHFMLSYFSRNDFWSSKVTQIVQRFQELFSELKYSEAAELAAESPQGILRTPETIAKFRVFSLSV